MPRSVLLSVQNIINVVSDNTSRITILQQQLPQFIQTRSKREGDEQMRKQRKASVRMRLTLYFLGVKESHGCIDLRVIFQSAHHIKSFFPYKDRFSRSQMPKVVYKASCWDCQDSYVGKTKRRLHDRKIEHFKGKYLSGICIYLCIYLSCICYRRPRHGNWSQLQMGPL